MGGRRHSWTKRTKEKWFDQQRKLASIRKDRVTMTEREGVEGKLALTQGKRSENKPPGEGREMRKRGP